MTTIGAFYLSIIFFLLSSGTSWAGNSQSLQWVSAADMFSPHDVVGDAIAFKNKIYVSTAYNDANPPTPDEAAAIYSSTGANPWTLVSHNAFSPNDFIDCFAILDNQLYAAGIQFHVYNGDDTHPQWTTLGAQGIPAVDPLFLRMITFHHKIYALVMDRDQDTESMYRFDPATHFWTNVGTNLPYGRYYSLAINNDTLYLGGNDGSNYVAIVEVYNGNDLKPNWSQVYRGPAESSLLTITSSNNMLFAGITFISGYDSIGSVLAYNGNDQAPQWTDISHGLPSPHGEVNTSSMMTALGSYNNRLFAGLNDNNQGRTFVYAFNGDLKNPYWSSMSNGFPTYPQSPTMLWKLFEFNDMLYASGDFGGVNKAFLYSLRLY